MNTHELRNDLAWETKKLEDLRAIIANAPKDVPVATVAAFNDMVTAAHNRISQLKLDLAKALLSDIFALMGELEAIDLIPELDKLAVEWELEQTPASKEKFIDAMHSHAWSSLFAELDGDSVNDYVESAVEDEMTLSYTTLNALKNWY